MVQRLEAVRLHALLGRGAGEGAAACRVHQPVGPGPQQQRGYLPVRGAGHGGRPGLGDEARQPRADAVVAQRIGQVGAHHGVVMREVARVQPVAHAQVGRDARQRGQQQLLHRAQPGIERGRGQHQRIDRPYPEGDEARRHQPAHAVAQQHQRLARRHARARGIDDVGQVVEQARVPRQPATRPAGFAMPVVVVAAHRVAPGAQMPCQRVVAPGVLAQTVHQEHRGARCVGQGPVVHGKVFAIAGREGCQRVGEGVQVRGVRHGASAGAGLDAS